MSLLLLLLSIRFRTTFYSDRRFQFFSGELLAFCNSSSFVFWVLFLSFFFSFSFVWSFLLLCFTLVIGKLTFSHFVICLWKLRLSWLSEAYKVSSFFCSFDDVFSNQIPSNYLDESLWISNVSMLWISCVCWILLRVIDFESLVMSYWFEWSAAISLVLACVISLVLACVRFWIRCFVSVHVSTWTVVLQCDLSWFPWANNLILVSVPKFQTDAVLSLCYLLISFIIIFSLSSWQLFLPLVWNSAPEVKGYHCKREHKWIVFAQVLVQKLVWLIPVQGLMSQLMVTQIIEIWGLARNLALIIL